MCRYIEEIGGRRVAQIKNLFVAKKQSFFDARLQRFPNVKKAEKAKNVFAIDSPQCYFHSKPPWPIFYIPCRKHIYIYPDGCAWTCVR